MTRSSCPRHPAEPGWLSCTRCGEAMCARCVKSLDVGELCPDCVPSARGLRPLLIVTAALAALLASSSWLWWDHQTADSYQNAWATASKDLLPLPVLKPPGGLGKPASMAVGAPASRAAAKTPDALRALLSREPCDRSATRRLMGMLALDGKAREALEVAGAFRRGCGPWRPLLPLIAQLHENLSQLSEARAVWTEYAEAEPTDLQGWALRGVFLEKRAKAPLAAAESYRRALALDPDQEDLPQNLANVLEAAGRPCEAILPLEQLLFRHPRYRALARLTAQLARLKAHKACRKQQGRGRADVRYGGQLDMLEVEVLVGDRRVRAVVDTGASYVTIPKALALELGLDLEGAPVTRIKAVGAIREARVVRLYRVKLAGAQARDVEALVLDTVFPGTDAILLGLSFLSRFKFTVDPRKKRLSLSPAD